ncbi:hypothetical protein M0R19_08550 [Candidatus Pacearchaeota archaeon]|jgi:hypothetical protein|nr:hypothetical protein [bacterium]MCK9597207.1 hypothetical protein [Candidatus Pacearchaeota archaeon]
MKKFKMTKEMISLKLSEILKESFGIIDFLPSFRLGSDMGIDENDLYLFLNLIDQHFNLDFTNENRSNMENIKIGKLIDMIFSLTNKK